MIVAVTLLVAYLLGSVSGSLLLGRLRGVDIRTRGSGNAGGTNALRTMGWRFALPVVLIDVGKGALAVILALGAGLAVSVAWIALILAVAGHTWPLWFGFRGGKGMATLLGGLLVLWPWSLLGVLGVWLASIVLSGYVGLSSILAALCLPLLALLLPAPERLPFTVVLAALIVFNHRSNIARLHAGSEPRFDRVRLFVRRHP